LPQFPPRNTIDTVFRRARGRRTGDDRTPNRASRVCISGDERSRLL